MYSSNGAWDEDVPLSVPLVLHEWLAILQSQSPWSEMPPDDLRGEFPSLVRELVNEGAEPRGEKVARVFSAAREHGHFRRVQGCSQSVVIAELRALRLAFDDAMTRAQWPELLRADYHVIVAAQIGEVLDAVMRGWSELSTTYARDSG